jgi:catechol 2,3-dioxygenase
LGHVNLWVGDPVRSHDFYNGVLGLEVVLREHELGAVFFSNGNTHHDLALFETSMEDRFDANGVLQISKERGARVGLNHLAFETYSIAALAKGCDQLLEHGAVISRSFDHGVSRSIYLMDPDGLSVELYADAVDDWRGYFAMCSGEVVTTAWDHRLDGSDVRPHFPVNPVLRRSAHAPFPCTQLARAAITVSDFAGSLAFYEEVVGLQAVVVGDQWAVLAGTTGEPVLGIFEVEPHDLLGLHHFSFVVADTALLRAGAQAVDPSHVVRSIDNDFKRSAVLADPDGFLCEVIADDSVRDLPANCANVSAGSALLELF